MDPICFHIGSRPVYWYGIMMALAFLAGIAHWRWLGRRTGRDVTLAGDLAFWLMAGGILGARVAYVISNFNYFRAAPAEIIRIDQGGLIFYGGFIGGFIAFLVFTRWNRIPFLGLADFAITALPLGHALGRIGCFLNGCCGGSLAPASSVFAGGMPRYPVQLYEALYNLGVYAVLTLFFLARKNRAPGAVLALYLLIYPVGRFLLEFIRGDERMRPGGLALDVAQLVSLGLFAAGSLLWLSLHRCRTRT